jgi:hypothetical protein
MKTFLAIYLGGAAGPQRAAWDKLDDATRQARMAEGMKAWHAWQNGNKGAILVQGGPLGKTKRVSQSGITDTKNAMTGYIVVQAETHEAAARMFENHPHFTIFPGESIEVMECLPIPGAS